MSDQGSRDTHTVALELKRRIIRGRIYGNVKVEEAVLEHGRPFIGIERPKGYRRRAAKQCFVNAGDLAYRGRGVYVEGFAMLDNNFPFHHAWITRDGVQAIDVTLTDPGPGVSYLGIPFSLEVLERWIGKRGHWTLLDALDTDTEELLADARRNPLPARRHPRLIIRATLFLS
jgi:hypothetical protein